jgi:CDP-paratose 2-epimerase
MNEIMLITGGCGFVGSSLAIRLKREFPSCKVKAFDNLRRRGSELAIARLGDAGVEFIHGDIRNREDFDSIGEISVLIEAAAEPSVLSGIDSTPDYVLNTNLAGTINCLNFAMKNNAKFVFLSTSRVYPISSLNRIKYSEADLRFEISPRQEVAGISVNGISEEFPLNGARSFYGASKLSSELIIQEYAEFYRLRTIINRFGVIAGPWQMGKVDQGVVVLWLVKHFWNKELSYIGFGGQGKQVRDIVHIDDLYSLVKAQLADFDLYNGQIFNVGGGRDVSTSLKELTVLCREITGNSIPIHSIKENRAADVPIYVTDHSKISGLSGWKPEYDVRKILIDIFEWIRENEVQLKPLFK